MDNWKDAWDHMQLVNGSSDHNDEKETESTSRMWRRDGFMKSASEYWLLCRVIMDRIQSDSLDGNDLIKPTLGKYDQTDMGQVNDLIAQFNLMSMT